MTRGRGRGRGRTRGRSRCKGRAQSRARAEAPVVEPQVDLGAEVLAQIVHAGGGEQTPTTPTLEHMAPIVPPVGVIQPVVAAHACDRHAMSSEALLRLKKFTNLFPVHFSCTPSEDQQDYIDRCHEVMQNMVLVESNMVDFAVFQMAGFAKRWWRDYMLTRPAGSPALTWDHFSQLFLEKFIHTTLREEYHRPFEHIQYGSMIVTQYETRFVDLACHAIVLIPTTKERVRRLIDGLTYTIRLQMDKEAGSDISF
ncbi:uncharacterized protein [Nicotiana tomentosiformis]|uniref:uncharacterized protein n=1 Tax=Nicotiana tomentosiformis TaxID=4098 RepID=UPI00388C90DC